MQQTKNYPAVVEKIHKEFYSASERLLEEAKKHLEKVDVNKAKRLQSIGFTNSVDVRRMNEVSVNEETANYINKYMVSYPNNKFIDETTVKKICKKYNLVCAPIDRYKGFVPKDVLPKMEVFAIKQEDKAEQLVKVTEWAHKSIQGKDIDNIEKHFPNGIPQSAIISNSVILSYLGIEQFGEYSSVSMRKYEVIGSSSKLICAPRKDMDLKGLSKFGYFFKSITTVHVPDPVVLAPVKGGYLIVAAWGDEQNDPMVTNERHN